MNIKDNKGNTFCIYFSLLLSFIINQAFWWIFPNVDSLKGDKGDSFLPFFQRPLFCILSNFKEYSILLIDKYIRRCAMVEISIWKENC